MKQRRQWVKFPSNWVQLEGGLKQFTTMNCAAHASAIMCLVVLAHEADEQSGVATATYDHLQLAIGKSRSLISQGLQALQAFDLVKATNVRSSYALQSYDPSGGWAKLPCRLLYNGSTITAFNEFTLRKTAELDALKLFLLFAAFRDGSKNYAAISYEKISEHSGIPKDRIRRAIALLATYGLVFSEQIASERSEYGIAHGYRLAGIEPFIHSGTRGRSELFG